MIYVFIVAGHKNDAGLPNKPETGIHHKAKINGPVRAFEYLYAVRLYRFVAHNCLRLSGADFQV